MAEEGIALVLSRDSLLRSKITNCINNSSYCNIPTQTPTGTPNPEYVDDEEETESFIAIRYSLTIFEAALSSLLIREYKGRDLDFIHEVPAFASSMNINDLQSQIDHPNGYPEASVVESKFRIPFKGFGKVIGGVAKTVFTIVGFITVMHMSDFELRRKKREFKVWLKN
ncbi:plastid division protein PDV2-like [Rutidosis leptorrhynchoides]|uniref:plastid division protein PDV2-like n=1 Tax=Rutidosis leptorrhynchoides TaxID=125765 RepID=UPI003A9987E3